jgi:hypothetical protein
VRKVGRKVRKLGLLQIDLPILHRVVYRRLELNVRDCGGGNGDSAGKLEPKIGVGVRRNGRV